LKCRNYLKHQERRIRKYRRSSLKPKLKLEKFQLGIKNLKQYKSNMKIIVPMAGRGSAFAHILNYSKTILSIAGKPIARLLMSLLMKIAGHRRSRFFWR
jgi:hypothetical protein